MKLMFASDLHGSSRWCEKMLEACRRENAEKLCLLGDLLYHGPRNALPEGHDPKETAALLNSVRNELLCVRGNCDAEVDQMMLDFPILAEYALIYADGRTFFLTHGHRWNPDSLPPLKTGDALICGHTHILRAAQINGIHCLNVGSVTFPKENNPHSYMVYENGSFTIKDMDGTAILQYEMKE